jgi:aminoglycoside phosphotransferase (APT) family kinase protein
MTDVGPLLAKGRAADVFEYGEGRVLRRYRTPHRSEFEGNVMRHVREHGYPVPEVFDASGDDLVMERLDGPTMLDDFSSHPWRMFDHARTLADLIKKLHEIPPLDGLKSKHPDPSVIVHLDLHPENVMLTPKGPVVIDWSNAGLGDPDAEVADLWLVMACAKPPVSLLDRVLIGIGRALFVRALLGHFDKDRIRRRLRVAHELRSRDRNMSAEELGRMARLLERHGN